MKLSSLSIVALLVLLLAGFAVGTNALLTSSWLERTVEAKTLHLLHVVWGMAMALLISGVVGWLVLRKSIKPYTERLTLEEALPDRSREYRRHALWFVQLRWLATLLVGILSFLATHVLGLLDEHLFPLLAGLTLALLVSNLIFFQASRRAANPYRVIVAQTVCDLFFLTCLLHFSGGIENSLYVVYVFHVVIAAMLLSTRDSYIITTVACLLLTSATFGEYSGILSHYAIQLTPHEHAVQHEGEYVPGSSELDEPREHGVEPGSSESEEPAEHESTVAHVENHGLDGGEKIEDSHANVLHPAHDLTFVLGRLLPFLGILYCVTYLTQIVVIHLHRRERQLLRAMKERKLMEAQLVQAGKMAAIGELAGNLAHEVNNPVGVISGKAKLLLDEYGEDGLPPEVLNDLRKIDLHAGRIGRITNGLLVFSRPSLGKKESLDLNEVLRSTLVLLEDRLRSSGIQLVLHRDEGLPAVLGNRNEMQQVLYNVISNAIDAMSDGGELRVSTRAATAMTSRRDRTRVAKIVVSDSGRGMEREVLHRIFEPFFTTKDEGRGTGLGLPITQGLVRSHRGTIRVRSVVGRGTTFVIMLPVMNAKTAAQEEIDDAGHQGSDH